MVVNDVTAEMVVEKDLQEGDILSLHLDGFGVPSVIDSAPETEQGAIARM